ncbi:S41 family peptidase [Aquimarina algicola]|uniref:Tail specific protease domain-containing protein n=1 Tax=Aquimarina algicola TaxID=2589995 RepID=A0A504IXU5_9FLAO|nr:S41 family peptidase [Aquimarina algicola]TPN82884.1 hypothetical protein FHK87_20880 [Aquimarina algicola]
MIRFLITTLLLLITLSGCSQTTPVNVCFQSANVEHWSEDIDLYKINLEKYHIDLYNKISKVEFEEELQQIKSKLNKKTNIDVIIDLMRLTRKIGDGHTSFLAKGIEMHKFPIEVHYTNQHWKVIKTTLEHKNLLGTTLASIDGISINEIAEKIGEIAQYVENDQSKIHRTKQNLMNVEFLYGLQLTKQKFEAEFTFLDNNNKKTKASLKAISNKDYYENTEFQSIKTVIPGLEKPADSKHDFLWFSPIRDTKAVYIKFQSYPSFTEMESFGESILTFIKKNNIKQIVIDLRNNGGGDFFVGTFLAYYLNLSDSIDWKSGVYVLTDKVTFSAATSNASQFRQILNAKIVGEPTGSNPTGYQDMGQFVLPNSEMIVTYSKRLFRFQDQITQGVQPDVLIEYDWESFSKGIDNVMEWVINDIKEK